MNPSLVLFSLLLLVSYSSAKKIPSYVTLCRRNDPELTACLKRAIEQLRPHLGEGIPEMLIPPMDPLVLPEAGLDSGDNFRATFKNIQLNYVDEFKIEHLLFDLDRVHLELGVSFKRMRIRSQYNIKGRILILQLNGQGPADGNLTDISANIVVDGNRYIKNGKEYLSFTEKKLEMRLGTPTFKFDNIFKDNQELNDQTNKIINENVVDILDELRPVIDKTVLEMVFGIIGRIFNRFSLDELFPK